MRLQRERVELSGLIAAIVVLLTACIQDLWAVARQEPTPTSFWSLLEARTLTLLTGAISFVAAYRVTAYKVDELKADIMVKADHKVVELMTSLIHEKLDGLTKGQERLDARLDVYGRAIITINETLARQEGTRRSPR